MDLASIQEAYRRVGDEVFGPLLPAIEAAADCMIAALAAGKKILFCGNGGSAADAQHFAGELVNRFLVERRAYAGIALTTDTSVLTAIANDYSFEEVFAKQVEALGQAGDVLVSLTTSGNSGNILAAMRRARQAGIVNVLMTGGNGGAASALADHLLSITASRSTPRIQEGHHLIMHLLCERVEAALAAGDGGETSEEKRA